MVYKIYIDNKRKGIHSRVEYLGKTIAKNKKEAIYRAHNEFKGEIWSTFPGIAEKTIFAIKD